MSGKRALIRGTAILTITSFVTRFMGFFYRIFLGHTFGEENVGLYQLVFPVYALGISFSCAGTELALSRCVAQENAAGHPEKAKELLKTGLIFTFVLSCILTIFLQHNAHMTAISFLHDSRCEELLILLSYTFPFASIHSCICGYSLGLKQTKIPAVSQLFEQTFRILFVFLFCYYRTSHQLDLSISFAVVGLAMGEIFAFLLLPVLYTPHSFETSAEFAFCKYFLHPSFQAFQTRLSSYCQPGIIEHSAKYRSRIHPRFSSVFRNVFFSVFAGIWSSDRYGTSLYSVSFCYYQRCILHASSYSGRNSGNEREAQTSGYHFKNRLFLHISWMFLLYFPANIREMDWNLSVQKSACG